MSSDYLPKICIAGKNSIAVYGLEKTLFHFGTESVLACPNKADIGQSNWQPSLLRFAKEFGVKVVSLEDLYGLEDLLFLSLEFDRIVKPSYFKSTKLFNIHFSKLPAYKGVYTSAWPILNGEIESAVTLHRIDHGIDTGEIIDQICLPIDRSETARSLYFKYLSMSERLLDNNFQALLDDDIKSIPQNAVGASYYCKQSINYSDLSVNVRQTANIIDRQIRAYSFRELQTPTINGFPIGKFQVTNQRSLLPAGATRVIDEDTIVLSSIDYDVLCYRDPSEDIFTSLKNLDVDGVLNAINSGCNLNMPNSFGWTPLIIASYNGCKPMVEALLNAGALPNQSNQNGTTPLMYAKESCEVSGDFSIMKLLMDAGADILKKDRFGKTLLDYAKIKGQVRTICFIMGKT